MDKVLIKIEKKHYAEITINCEKFKENFYGGKNGNC